MILWWLRHVGLVLSLSAYALLAPFGYVAFALFSMITRRDPVRRAQILQGIVHGAFRLLHRFLRVMRLIDFRPHSWDEARQGPYVIVANHPSLTDTTAVLACTHRVCAVVRSDVYSRPLVGPLMKAAGYIDAGGKGVQAVARWIDLAKLRFAQGFSVLIFPEGTRSPAGGGIHRMSRTAFELSCQAKVPILALAIFEEPTWLGRERGFLQMPKQIPHKSIERLGVFNPEDFQCDSRRMREAVQLRYQQLFKAPVPVIAPVLEHGSGVDLPRPTG